MICLDSEARTWSRDPSVVLSTKHWCGVFPNNFHPLCQRRHLQNVYNLQVGVFHSMSKVWQQHICRQMKFNCCYHSEILLAATTGRHSAAAGVTADTRSASFSTGIPKWRDLFKSRLCTPAPMFSSNVPSPVAPNHLLSSPYFPQRRCFQHSPVPMFPSP